MAVRLFIGIRIPPHLHERLEALQSGVPGARWVAPENFHITLGFLGDVEENRLEDLHEILAGIGGAPFSLTLSGTGSFGSKVPKLLWAGLEPAPALEALQKKIAGRLTREGLLVEARKFSPHVTLAYMRAAQQAKDPKLGAWFESTAPFLAAPFEVTEFALIESRLGSGGSHYVDLARYPVKSL